MLDALKKSWLLWVAALFFLLLPRFFELGSHITDLLVLFFIYIVLAQSWNIMGGYAGQINLGLAAFFGCGVFVTHIIWKAGVSIYLSVPAGGMATLVLVSFIGLPTLRLRGMHFAIGTLALAETLRMIMGNIFPRTLYMPVSYAVEYSLLHRYYLGLVIALITLITVFWLSNSKMGLAMVSLRDDEDAARASGVNIFRFKVAAFAISAFLAGLAGGTYAYFRLSFAPVSVFTPNWTFAPLMAAAIGGSGTLGGPIVGCIFLVLLEEIFALAIGETHFIVFGLLFILVVLYFPYGIVGSAHKMHSLLLGFKNKERKTFSR